MKYISMLLAIVALALAASLVSCNSQSIKKATVITVEGDTVEFVGGRIEEGYKANGYWRACRMTRITPVKNKYGNN